MLDVGCSMFNIHSKNNLALIGLAPVPAMGTAAMVRGNHGGDCPYTAYLAYVHYRE